MIGQLKYPNWLRDMTRGKEYLFRRDEPVFCATSAGKTSALMAFLTREHVNGKVFYGFQNTGLEHSQTYLFWQRLVKQAGIPVACSEFRKPLVKGAPPRESRYEFVTPETCARNGEPFRWMFETLAEYREAIGRTPYKISGGPKMRLCSSYLKTKQAEKIAKDLFGDDEPYTSFIGFRADEPERVGRLKARETAIKSLAAPLSELGIKQIDVARFWMEQSFTLDCPENLGNCDLCFLKDQGDLAHNMAYEVTPERRQFWIDIQDEYGQFEAGKDYRQLFSEAPAREQIRRGIVGGLLPIVPVGMTERRFKLLVAQELRRTSKNIQRMQCNCEVSELLTDEDIEAV